MAGEVHDRAASAEPRNRAGSLAPMTQDLLSVVIAGGGTAGHIEPAWAVGEALRREHHARITALGTAKGLERDLIPARGGDLRLVTPVPIPRKLTGAMLKLPFTIVKSVHEARQILKDVGADVVFGTGGYVAAPAYLAAKSMGLPFFVLETNALAGMANKLGVRLGGVGLNAHANSGMPGEVVGIPVRAGLREKVVNPDNRQVQAAKRAWGLGERPTILVTGGSQGAASINQAVAGALPDLTEDFQVLHAYGKKNPAPQPRAHYVAVPYIEQMDNALALADIVVCRSGAMTVAEVSAAGRPAIYIPLPHGNGEQALNCRDVVAHGGAIQVLDAELTPERLVTEVRGILDHPGRKEAMEKAAATSAAGNVASNIAQRVVDIVGARKDS